MTGIFLPGYRTDPAVVPVVPGGGRGLSSNKVAANYKVVQIWMLRRRTTDPGSRRSRRRLVDLEDYLRRLVARCFARCLVQALGVESGEGKMLSSKGGEPGAEKLLLAFAEKSLEMMRRTDPLNLDRQQNPVTDFVAAQSCL